MKGKVEDLVAAIKEEGITAGLESDVFLPIAVEGTSQIISGAAGPLVGAIIGASAPIINGIILSYKQNRYERNIKRLVTELQKRITDLEINYTQLNEEIQEKYRGLYVEMLLDNVVDERQEEKIGWSVSGFINMMTNETNENILQLFYETLTELTLLDVDTLKMYSVSEEMNWSDIEKKYGLDKDKFRVVKEKLTRLGLLYRKNDQQRNVNLDEMTEYLMKCEEESKKTRPQNVSLSRKIKKIKNAELYGITALGNSFLKSIGEI